MGPPRREKNCVSYKIILLLEEYFNQRQL